MVDKKGIVYRQIAETLLRDRKSRFVERELARELGISPDTVSNAIAPLKRIGAATVYRRYFEVHDLNKLLVFWAVGRRLERDIVYRTWVETQSISSVEDHMPDGTAYTCFSGYSRWFSGPAADYSEVYVYATEQALAEIRKRFPEREFSKGVERYNLFVLRPDHALAKIIDDGKQEHGSAPLSQIYVDLWNLKQWQAAEFLKRLEPRIGEMYAKAVLE